MQSPFLGGTMQKQNFTSTKEVLAHLQDRGLRVSKSKIYEDKSKGFLKAQADGSFTKRDVDKYAATLTSHALPDKELAVAQEYASRKAKAEAEKLEEQAKAERFKNDVREGKFIPRDDVEVELAARAGVLATGLRTAFETQMLDFIYLVGGDPKKAANLLLAYERQLDMALNEYSRPIAYDVSLEDFYENDDFGENEG